MKIYEGMFLVDPAQALDWEKVEGEIRRVIERHGGEIINIGKWAERKLEYPIRHHKRAVYIITHFKVDGEKIPMVRRDAELSEIILRYIILVDEDGVDWTPLEDGSTTAAPTAKEAEKPAEAAKKSEGGEGEKKTEGEEESAGEETSETTEEASPDAAAGEETPAEEAPAEEPAAETEKTEEAAE